MNITTSQYRQAMRGCFLTDVCPQLTEEVVLVMPTCRGKRVIHVGVVQKIEPVGMYRHLVYVHGLKHVEGMSY